LVICPFARPGSHCTFLRKLGHKDNRSSGAVRKPILEDIRTLRKLSEENRADTTKQLALKIRQLPAGMNKDRLATTLASLSTEGDLGRDTLQEVATTLAEALREQPIPTGPHGPQMPYSELAKLVRYEHVQMNLDDPQYAAAMSKIEAEDLRNQQMDFTLTDLHGKTWASKDLRGQVVLVNFWATWCPPCRTEMPDLESIYKRFKNDGLIVLAITDERQPKWSRSSMNTGSAIPSFLIRTKTCTTATESFSLKPSI
jgi:thiol-disulfide isomerase/thioredoxin